MGDLPELPEPYGYSPFEGELYEPDQLDEEVKATAMQLFTVSQIQAFAEEAVRLKDAEIARMREVRNDNAEEWRAEVSLCRERIAELEEAVRLERERILGRLLRETGLPESYDGPWKVGDEYLAYHPSASHVPPDLRDCWNRCYWAGRAAYRELWTAAARVGFSNGFDAAYPANLDALNALLQRTRPNSRETA